jgi:hypothetical protein
MHKTNTPSEAYLAKLARDSFLTFWGYPNLYTDEGRGPSGDGKEFADFTVVFGQDVIIFSDKHIQFSTQKSLEISWNRWCRRAIKNSAKQLLGAESWLQRFPERLFLDRKCQRPFPWKLPTKNELRVHKIVVANGAAEQVRLYSNKDIPSLFVSTDGDEKESEYQPFCALQPFKSRSFFHILDEATLDLLLRELDTIRDFLDYIEERERVGQLPNVTILAAGEEQMLGVYKATLRENKRRILPPEGIDTWLVPDGVWQRFASSTEYHSRLEADKVSYLWDTLIEKFTFHALSGRKNGPLDDVLPLPSLGDQQKVLREMAAESRLTRRNLSQWFLDGLRIAKNQPEFTRMRCTNDPTKGYVLFFAKPPQGMTYREYRSRRSYGLHGHMLDCKLRFPEVTRVIGITSDALATEDPQNTEDLMFMECDNWTPQDKDDAEAAIRELGIGNPDTQVRIIIPGEREYPASGVTE